jgi:hypothetical protein
MRTKNENLSVGEGFRKKNKTDDDDQRSRIQSTLPI